MLLSKMECILYLLHWLLWYFTTHRHNVERSSLIYRFPPLQIFNLHPLFLPTVQTSTDQTCRWSQITQVSSVMAFVQGDVGHWHLFPDECYFLDQIPGWLLRKAKKEMTNVYDSQQKWNRLRIMNITIFIIIGKSFYTSPKKITRLTLLENHQRMEYKQQN